MYNHINRQQILNIKLTKLYPVFLTSCFQQPIGARPYIQVLNLAPISQLQFVRPSRLTEFILQRPLYSFLVYTNFQVAIDFPVF